MAMNGNIKKAKDVKQALTILDTLEDEFNTAVNHVNSVEAKATNLINLIHDNNFIVDHVSLEADVQAVLDKVTNAKTALMAP